MATPIENYLKGEREIDSQSYLSKGISRRGFLKLAGTTAAGAVFGEGLLKQIEALGQDQFSVYFENFEVDGDPSQGGFQNVEKTLPKSLARYLAKKGITVITRPDYIRNDTIIVRGAFTYTPNDPEMPIAYMSGARAGSVKIDVEFEQDGALLDSKSFKYDSRRWGDQIFDDVGERITEYLRWKDGAQSKERITNFDITNSDKIDIEIAGERRVVEKSRLRKAVLPKKVLDGLNSSNPQEKSYWKEWQKKENIGFGSDGQCYYIIR